MKPIDAQRWSAVCRLFEELVELDETARAERLAAVGAADADLRDSVQQLLAADAQADARLADIERVLTSVVSRDPESDVADTLQLVGRTISRFRIIEPLARGGMGVVYRAEDTLLQRAVALKFPLPSQRIESRAKERFLHEARTAGSLDHPNLCAIHEIGESESGELFIAMPLYDGETLKARIARTAPLPVDDALDIARQLAQGLAAAHAAGVVHRDLKPANIMLLPDGTLKILDFGLAKIEDVTLTASHARIGTVSYMAPEQISGDAVDVRADLWSLGVVLFEMLTAQRPFAGEHDVSIAHAIVHQAPALPSVLRRDLPRVIEDLIIALLQKDPGKRPGMQEVESELQALHSGRSLPLRTRWQRRARTSYQRFRAQPRRFALATAGIAVLLLAGGGWVARGLLRPAATGADHSVVVLPFANPSGQAAVEYLNVGLLDGVIEHLRTVKDIRVTSRQTALSYRASTKSIQQIAKELGVATVLQGTIERVGDRIRVSARLLNASTGQPLWGQQFERSQADILAVQEEVARSVARSLGVAASRAEEAELRRRPTANAAAYDLYLRAHEYELRIPTPEGQQAAETLYRQALQLDSTFALARARLAAISLEIYGNRFDRRPERLERARADAEAALRMQPGLPDARVALGNYWIYRAEYQRALEQFQLALKSAPNNAEVYSSMGWTYNQMQKLPAAIVAIERALQLDPGDIRTAWNLAGSYRALRRYQDAIKYENYVLERAPDGFMHMLSKGLDYLMWQGRTDTLAAMVERVNPSWNHQGAMTRARVILARVQRRPADAVKAVNEAREAEINYYRPAALARAQAYQSAGDAKRARTHYEQLVAAWQDSVRAHPDDAEMKAVLGLALAGLGRNSEAEAHARRALALIVREDPINPRRYVLSLIAEIYAYTGNAHSAVQVLNKLLTQPAGRYVSVNLLRADPLWDQIRSDPSFQQLIERHSEN